jgi:hypothetical protein
MVCLPACWLLIWSLSHTHTGWEDQELNRIDSHGVLARMLAADQVQLNEAVRAHKRALLTAQVEESRAVEAALAAAPKQLRWVCA